MALVVVAVIAYPKLPSLSDGQNSEGSNSDGSSQSEALLVDAHVVEPVTLEDRIRSTGSVLANETVQVRSEVSGRVTDIQFAEGETVSEGDLLVKINDSELQAERSQTELRRALVVDREERQRELLAEGGISQEEYDATLNELHVLEAELDLIQARIEKTEVRAPFDGVAGLREISRGSYISPETMITTVQELDPVRVEFTLPERYARRVGAGDQIRFTVEGLDQEFDAEVYALDPVVQEGTRSLRLRARASNPDRALFPGNFASVTYVIDSFDSALVVPAIAVVPGLEGRRVFVYQDGQAQPRPVETGLRTERNVQVLSGLAPQDTVITTGLQRMRPGLAVRLSETTEGRLPEVAPGGAAPEDAELPGAPTPETDDTEQLMEADGE